jgi:hypothetical protein
MSPAEQGTKNNYAGEDQQQFTGPGLKYDELERFARKRAWSNLGIIPAFALQD